MGGRQLRHAAYLAAWLYLGAWIVALNRGWIPVAGWFVALAVAVAALLFVLAVLVSPRPVRAPVTAPDPHGVSRTE